jgi:diaminohydroxyphosphoribosylaminopyrimidine deaminase/5-amino-6-(5-phosphoribosylamino)uracil reductase
MRMALRLAEKARGRTSPNPMVGAVVVKQGAVIGRGYHKRAGELHAEAIALKKAGTAAKNATLYVTLEPCSHTNKRTPPCTPLVMQSGVKRVVVAMIDPNPQVSGRGIRTLRKRGIEVATGVLEAEAAKLNEAFVKYITFGLPFVTLKIAQTLDGKIATAKGESKWITGDQARAEGQWLRNSSDAILVGINTVLKDDPSLTVRIPGGRDPLRVVVDSMLRTPADATIIRQKSSAPTIVAALSSAPKARIRNLQDAGAEVLLVKSAAGRVDLRDLMKKLGRRGIMSVLIEGGAEVHASAIMSRIVDKIVLFVAPMLMTGRDSLCSIGGISPARLSQAIKLHNISVRFVGRDLLVEGYLGKVR